MNPTPRQTWRAALCLSLGWMAACAETPPPPPAVTVLAPSALEVLLRPVCDSWSAESGTPVVFGFDSPERVTRQALGGAPVDLFVSADTAWMDQLSAGGHITNADRAPLFYDPLIFVAAREAPPLPTDPMDLTVRGPVGLADDNSPEGRLATSALKTIQVWSAVEARAVRRPTGALAVGSLFAGKAAIAVVRQSAALDQGAALQVAPFSPTSPHASLVELATLPGSAEHHEAVALKRFMLERPQAGAAWQAAGMLRVPTDRAPRPPIPQSPPTPPRKPPPPPLP